MWIFKRGHKRISRVKARDQVRIDLIETDILNLILIEIAIYTFFLFVITSIALQSIDTDYYFFSKAVTSHFVESTFQTEFSETTFNQLSTITELWFWLMTVVLQGVSNDTLLEENKILGPARIRQLRVRNNSCEIYDTFKRHFRHCFGDFSTENMQRLPFGLKQGSAWNFQENEEFAPFSWGELESYPSGGYIQELFFDFEKNRDILNNLEANNWIDSGTRVLFLELTLYNPNINKFCATRLMAEIPSTGIVLTRTDIQTVNLLDFADSWDHYYLALEVFFLILVIFYTLEEVFEMLEHRFKYLTKLWNMVDLTIILLGYAMFGIYVYRKVKIDEKLEEYNENPGKFITFDVLVFWQKQYMNLIGICLFLAWIKSLKYFRFNKTLLQFSSTLGRCAKDLFGFGLMFLIVFVAYAQFGYLLFGSEIADFRSFKDAIFTLMRTILGDFEYLELEKANRILGPIYFLSYIFFVFFVLLNMFLAIINDTYTEVKCEITQDIVPFGSYLKDKCKRLFWILCCCKNEKCTWAVQQKSEEKVIKENPLKQASDEELEKLRNAYEKLLKEHIERTDHRLYKLEASIENVVERLDRVIEHFANKKKN